MSIDFSGEQDAPLITTSLTPGDAGEINLRPQTLRDYTGQEKAKSNLAVYIEAARRRNEPLDHVLLYGPPGLGKTTLAGVIANEMGVSLRVTSGPAIEKTGDLAALLDQSQRGRHPLHRRDPPAQPGRWRSCCTRPWRTTPSTSSSARAPPPTPSGWTCPSSP